MFNKLIKIATVSGLAAITALTPLSIGSVSVLAAEKLPTYVMDGTNAERAISDYFVNNFTYNNNDTVAIPHMDILYTETDGTALLAAGNFLVIEYGKESNSLVQQGTISKSAGCFYLDKNEDGTYTVFSYQSVPESATKQDFMKVFDINSTLANEAYDVYQENIHSDLWNAIRAEDIAYYSYDNDLGISKIDINESHEIDLANVSTSEETSFVAYVQEDTNVRSAGTTLSTSFDNVIKGDDLMVTGLANGWARVNMDNRTGYIPESLIDIEEPEEEQE